jgi:uncharacterized BrkB/YihY/UPF0761 family membrane protein
MKELFNSKFQKEVGLDRPPSSIWERIFRVGCYYLMITTIIGGIAEFIFGEIDGMPWWAWALTIPYMFFMLYCSNYMVHRFVKSKIVKVSWFGIMALLTVLFTSHFLST